MPNWCVNKTMFVFETEEEAKELFNQVNFIMNDKDGEEDGLFEYLRPRPEGTNWYEWNTENWGTKWDAFIFDTELVQSNIVSVGFETPWGPPIDLYDYLQEKGIRVVSGFNEVGCDFVGVYIDGEASGDSHWSMSSEADYNDDTWGEQMEDYRTFFVSRNTDGLIDMRGYPFGG